MNQGISFVYITGPRDLHINRLKLIKRSMYGRAQFDLLRLRVLHHLAKREVAQDAKTGADRQRWRNRTQQLRAEENTFTSQPTTVRISEVA